MVQRARKTWHRGGLLTWRADVGTSLPRIRQTAGSLRQAGGRGNLRDLLSHADKYAHHRRELFFRSFPAPLMNCILSIPLKRMCDSFSNTSTPPRIHIEHTHLSLCFLHCVSAHLRACGGEARGYHHMCVRACACMHSELAFKVHTKAPMPCIPTPSAPPPPPPE